MIGLPEVVGDSSMCSLLDQDNELKVAESCTEVHTGFVL